MASQTNEATWGWRPTITTYWRSEGLVHLEMNAPVWSGGLNLGQERALQTVARRAVAAITGATREEYTATCHRLGLDPDLAARRLQLCRRFAIRTATKSRHQDLFHKQENPHITRGGGKVWREPRCRTRRHLMSARPHLTRLLNGESSWYNDSVCLDLLGLVYPGSLMGPYNPHVIWDWAVPHQTIINPTLLLL